MKNRSRKDKLLDQNLGGQRDTYSDEHYYHPDTAFWCSYECPSDW
jgi:hypothetical protein